MRNVNLCEAIQCPFANSDVSGFGCRKYSVAGHCHLLHPPYSNPHSGRIRDIDNPNIIHETQYFLYGHPDDIDFNKIKQQNDEWLATPEIVEELQIEKEMLSEN